MGLALVVGSPAIAQTAIDMTRLIASDGSHSQRFGTSVAVSGDTVVIGAPEPVELETGGAAYIYALTEGVWTQQAKLVPDELSVLRNFGTSVDIDGDTAVIGDYAHSDSSPASVNVFRRDGSNWSPEAKLIEPPRPDNPYSFIPVFGSQVGVSGDTMIALSHNENTPDNNSDKKYIVYERAGTTWSRTGEFGSIEDSEYRTFGISSAISGETVLVGAKKFSDSPGVVFVFTRSDTGWIQQAKLVASDLTDSDGFGRAVALDGNTAIIGAVGAGKTYVFERSGSTWSEQSQLASDGQSVSLSADIALVGNLQRANEPVNTVDVYSRIGNAFIKQGVLTSDIAWSTWRFPSALAIDNMTAVAGAADENSDFGQGAGAAYVYSLQLDAIQIFSDVSLDRPDAPFIRALALSGITAGCDAERFCPDNLVTRAQLAVFLERAMNGSDFVPPVASGNVFLDVPANSFAANFIEQLFLDGVTSGCGGWNFCPQQEVTRAHVAVFLLRAKHGAYYRPPQAVGRFGDVDSSFWAVDWIDQLAEEGITVGCGGGNFCPHDPVTRAQMAVFLVRTFAL